MGPSTLSAVGSAPTVRPVDLAPAVWLLLLAALMAAAVLLVWWWRNRAASLHVKLQALATLTLFLTFDLLVFGAFTRLTDSGLGCPDWPGCYGQVSPLGAAAQIDAAARAMPTGPVTPAKAWIEMIHRYLAATVGALIVAMAIVAWRHRARLPYSLGWPLATVVWVIVQGLFGKYTVTLKLYPAFVTAHLLGAMLLLALLVAQVEAWRNRPIDWPRRTVGIVLIVVVAQVALGGWVGTNYAVLACRGFPQCNGTWWPTMDARGFELLRELGRDASGAYLPFEALVAIHFAHRLFALVSAAAVGLLAWNLWRDGRSTQRRYAVALAGLLGAQVATGVSNVILDWPIAAALTHSAGAAAMVGVLCSLLMRSRAPGLEGDGLLESRSS